MFAQSRNVLYQDKQFQGPRRKVLKKRLRSTIFNMISFQRAPLLLFKQDLIEFSRLSFELIVLLRVNLVSRRRKFSRKLILLMKFDVAFLALDIIENEKFSAKISPIKSNFFLIPLQIPQATDLFALHLFLPPLYRRAQQTKPNCVTSSRCPTDKLCHQRQHRST